MTFLHQLISAKQGDNYAVEFLLEMYRPLLVKEAIVDGIFDEDLYQELCMQFCVCIRCRWNTALPYKAADPAVTLKNQKIL